MRTLEYVVLSIVMAVVAIISAIMIGNYIERQMQIGIDQFDQAAK